MRPPPSIRLLENVADTSNNRTRRHLLRLWLRNEELAWDIPAGLKPYYNKIYYGLKPEEQKIPLQPEVRIGFATVGPKE